MAAKKLLTLASMPLMALAGEFQLYAYGTGVSALTMFSANNLAYVGDVSKWNSSNAVDVVFTTGTDNTFVANPEGNTTAVNWSNLPLYVPSDSTSSTQAGFFTRNSSAADCIISSFALYDQTAMLITSGSGQTLWRLKETSVDGVYSVHWTSDSTDDTIAVSLRSTALASS